MRGRVGELVWRIFGGQATRRDQGWERRAQAVEIEGLEAGTAIELEECKLSGGDVRGRTGCELLALELVIREEEDWGSFKLRKRASEFWIAGLVGRCRLWGESHCVCFSCFNCFDSFDCFVCFYFAS